MRTERFGRCEAIFAGIGRIRGDGGGSGLQYKSVAPLLPAK